MQKNDRGIIYFVSGEDYIKEANNSAKSVKSMLPDIPIAIFTDGKGKDFIDDKLFDKIITSTSGTGHKTARIESLLNSPFDKTLFLDSDTELLEPVNELFELLDNFDLAAAHAPKRSGRLMDNPGLECFPECNTGVLLYRKSEKISEFFNSWINIYNEFRVENISSQDQPSFRKALYSSTIRFYILPPEYNLRTIYPYFAGDMKVKIIHGRGRSFQRARESINDKIKLRTGNFNRGYIGNLVSELVNKLF